MIRGLVQVFDENNNLIYCEGNLIVDGAGEHIANFMTMPTDGSFISAASAIYDASNYRIAAISYAKPENLYLSAGHSKTGIPLAGRQNGQLWLETSSATASSPLLFDVLADSPNPIDTKLTNFEIPELLSYASAGLLYANTLVGQNLNLLHFRNLIPSTVFGFNVSSQPLSALLQLGSFTPSDTITIHLRYKDGTTNGQFVASTTLNAGANNGVNGSSYQCADFRGFIQPAKSIPTNPITGLVSSSVSPVSSTGQTIYYHTIRSNDTKFLNFYGGITTMGLWVLDINSMLARGLNPPYLTQYDDPGLNMLDYKLFNKKVFKDNIVKFSDNSSTPALTSALGGVAIVWHLYFI